MQDAKDLKLLFQFGFHAMTARDRYGTPLYRCLNLLTDDC